MTDTPTTPPELEPGLVAYARSELDRAGLFDSDADYGRRFVEHILDMVRMFAAGGHSGGSATLAIEVLGKLLAFEPLTPLTYEPDEWVDQSEASGTPMWQNRRKIDVFSVDQGATWYCLDGTKGMRPGDALNEEP